MGLLSQGCLASKYSRMAARALAAKGRESTYSVAQRLAFSIVLYKDLHNHVRSMGQDGIN